MESFDWFLAIVGSGTVNALVSYFIQRFVVKPVDKHINNLTTVIQTFNKNVEEKLPKIERSLLKNGK